MACGVSYDGNGFSGWQMQSCVSSIQEEIESALSSIADHSVRITCAGRTDKGVHATGQVIHFDTTANRNPIAWLRGTNTKLKHTKVRIHGLKEVSTHFHARFDAQSRTYMYIIDPRPLSPTHHRDLVLWHPRQLNIERMSEAAQYWIGEHDFSAFRASGCQAKSPIKTLHMFHISEYNGYVLLVVKASAFLYHMVRYFVAVLLMIGRGEKTVQYADELLKCKSNVSELKKLVSPSGLYLVNVAYPDQSLDAFSGQHWLVSKNKMEQLIHGR